jgi:transcriptional regulator GlxA family with amidase domain
MNIGILVFDEVEVLDFAGPFEVLTTAARVHGRTQAPGTAPLWQVHLISSQPFLGRGWVCARAGLRFQASFSLQQHPPLQVLLVPGGVVDAELQRPELLAWIAQQAARVQLLAAVCTGAFLLAEAGCLQGQACTTHWEDVAALRARYPALRVQEGVRWVDQGRVITSAGISAGIDMSLHLVQRLHSRELALATARQMDFEWRQQP